MLKLDNLKSPGAVRKNKRLGRGQGSGRGTQAGKGHKGQKARSGGGVRMGFEGGAMPLYMRLPKKGFSNAPFKKVYAAINLGDIEKKFEKEEVSREALIQKGFLKGHKRRLPIKILGEGDFTKNLTFVHVDKFSKSAKTKIEKVGGVIQERKA